MIGVTGRTFIESINSMQNACSSGVANYHQDYDVTHPIIKPMARDIDIFFATS
ncbi:hypothetical protein BSL78_23693 [Apostichopus japonicus]|uniref:Uncharacterized protein n=1 Tax=Stichopus japonicus TaxID=307972 RepID=A0A2G8JUT9_STIJA|nr:hypothetical protein BSL78_23693 [Apostichopus japonicus]